MATRIDALKTWMKKEGIESLFVDDPIDLLYLTGLSLSVGRLFVSLEKLCLFVDGRYIDAAKQSNCCDVELPKELKRYVLGVQSIVFDSSFTSFEGYLELKKTFPDVHFVPLIKPLKDLRMRKDVFEIEALRQAAILTREGYHHICSLLEEGISEEALALEFEIFCRRKGASKLSFEPIIAFGENSAYPHYRAGKSRLKKDQIVLFDLGCVVNGYAGDMTRAVFFGTPCKQLEKDYALIQAVQKKVIDHVAPGVCFGDLDQIAREELGKFGCASLMTHGLSHGIGLEVHEYPRLRVSSGDHKLVLEPGMAFTVEPGIYRLGLGGVRFEDVVVVTKEGHETL